MTTRSGGGTNTLCEDLATFVDAVRFEQLPAEVVERLRLHALDLLGVCLLGARMPFADILEATVAQAGGVPESALVGRSGMRLPATSAALFIGGLAHGNEFDDTYPPGRWHASAATLPALFATADATGASGKAFLAAAAASMEVGCRLTRAAPGLLLRGFHSTACAGVLCSALGVAKLMGLDPGRIAAAMSIAGCFASGTTEFLNDPDAWPKRIQVGYAAQGAVLAARAAANGFNGPRTILEGKYGYFRSYAGEGNYDVSGLLEGLGTHWELLHLYPKRYPCDHIAQGYIDCAAAIFREHRVIPGDIEGVDVVVHPLGRAVMFEPRDLRYRPSNGWSARWSMPFNMAAALTDGEVTIDSYADERARDYVTRALMARVMPVEDATLPFPGDYPAWVRVRMSSGEVFERKQMQAAGSTANPMDASEYERKFANNAGRALQADRVHALIDAFRRLPELTSMSEVAALYG